MTELVEWTGLENRRRLIAYPGFESLSLRHIHNTFNYLYRNKAITQHKAHHYFNGGFFVA